MYTYVYVYLYLYTSIDIMYIYMYIYTCIHVSSQECMYTYIHTQKQRTHTQMGKCVLIDLKTYQPRSQLLHFISSELAVY